MTTITFDHQFVYSGNKVVVRVRPVRARLHSHIEMVVDTGAGISILDRGFAAALGLEVRHGRHVVIDVANGQSADGFVHDVEVEVLGRQLTIPVAICPHWKMQNLLGMNGFLDQLVIAFDHANHRIYY